MTPQLRKARLGAAGLVLIACVFGLPFALLGFIFQFIKAAFEVGQGAAAALGEWMKKQ
jgi:hypothetical protein